MRSWIAVLLSVLVFSGCAESEMNSAVKQMDSDAEVEASDPKQDHPGFDLSVFNDARCPYWGSANISYSMDAAFRKNYGAAMILARDAFNKRSPLKLVEKTSGKRLKFVSTGKISGGVTYCSSGSPTIDIGQIEASPDVSKAGYIVHETLHAIGFAHEQQRTDRAKYVDVIKPIPTAYLRGNNDMIATSRCDGGFDFDSIMYNFRGNYAKKPSSTWSGYGLTNRSDRNYEYSFMSYSDIAALWRTKYGNKNISCFPPAAPTVTLTPAATTIKVDLKHGTSPGLLGGYVVAVEETSKAATMTCEKGVNIAKAIVYTFKTLKPKTSYTVATCVFGSELGKARFLSAPIKSKITTAAD